MIVFLSPENSTGVHLQHRRKARLLGSVVKDGSERATLLVSLRYEDTVLGGNEYEHLCLSLCSFLVAKMTFYVTNSIK